MRVLVRLIVLSAAGVLLAGTWASAFAQGTPPARPRGGGLFGYSRPVQTPGHGLNVNATLAEAYDDDVTSEGGPTFLPENADVSGYYSLMTAEAAYGWRGRQAQLALTGLSALRYYGNLDGLRAETSSVAAGFVVNLSPRTTWQVNQTAAYSPSYFYGLFPSVAPASEVGDLPPTAAPNYALDMRKSLNYSTATTLTHRVSRSASISVGGDVGYTDFQKPSSSELRDLRTYGVHTQFSQGLSRSRTLRLGYHYRHGDTGGLGTGFTTEHGIEFGLDTVKRLSPSRQATFTFIIGSAAVDQPNVSIAATPVAGTTRLYRVSADVSAGYQFGRSWEVRGVYRRGLEYVPSLTTPVFIDAVNTSIGGLFSRRIDFLLSGAYSNGKSAFAGPSSYGTYTGAVRMRYALTSNWAAFGEYLYYYYDFRAVQYLLPIGMVPSFERNGVRVGITLWISPLGR
jgi:hypothetical protein